MVLAGLEKKKEGSSLPSLGRHARRGSHFLVTRHAINGSKIGGGDLLPFFYGGRSDPFAGFGARQAWSSCAEAGCVGCSTESTESFIPKKLRESGGAALAWRWP